jgi:hypothetical protein
MLVTGAPLVEAVGIFLAPFLAIHLGELVLSAIVVMERPTMRQAAVGTLGVTPVAVARQQVVGTLGVTPVVVARQRVVGTAAAATPAAAVMTV